LWKYQNFINDNRYYEKIGKNEPVDITDDLPFDIPDSWEWIRLGNIGDWGAGATPNRTVPSYYGGNIPWIKTGELNNSYITNSVEYVTEKALKECSLRLNQPGDILIAMYGATIGKLGIATIQLTTNQACCACTCFSGLFNMYLFTYLKAIKDNLIKQGSGGAQPNISREKIVANFIPLPPLTEQQRIVEKIESMEPYLAQYDKIEKQLTKLESEIKDKLKKSILQYAIQGKLVKQDPNDEPASVLLERIKAEKEQLIKEGKIKRDKNESFIYKGDDKNYYENIPQNWAICPLNKLCKHIKAGGDKPQDYSKSYNSCYKYPIVANGLSNEGIIGFSKKYTINEPSITISGRGTIGYPVIRNYPYNPIVRLLVLIPFSLVNINYLSIILSLKCNNSTGTSIQQLTVPMISDINIELPPYIEQQRIVNKINLLFNLF